jgi:membrane associated rhomboid family serine protease
MGIYNRDYFRNDQRRLREGWLASGYKWLIAANVVVFVLQLLVTQTELIPVDDQHVAQVRIPIVTQAFELAPARVLHGQVWRLVTYAFCHDVRWVLHILFNMLFLAWFGATLERMYGTREFVMFYLLAAIVSGLAFVALAVVLGDPTPALGASGAVMAVVALYATHFPREEIYLLGLIRLQIRYFVLLYLVYDLWPVLGALGGGGQSDGVAHSAHLGGLAFGYLYHRSGLRLERAWDGLKRFQPTWKRFRSPSRPESVRLYDPHEEREQNLDVKVDVILQKILAHGEASLTDQERDLLRKASQRYKEKPRNR